MATNGCGRDDDEKGASGKDNVPDQADMATEKREENGNANILSEDHLVRETTLPSPLRCKDVLAWLTGLAVSPGTTKIDGELDRKMKVELIKVRRHSIYQNPECRRSKRKFEKFLNDAKVSTTSKSNSSSSSTSNSRKRAKLSCYSPHVPGIAAINLRKTAPDLSSSGNEDLNLVGSPCKASKSVVSPANLSGSLGNHQEDGEIKRAVIPVGPKFQADVPSWSEPTRPVSGHSVNDTQSMQGSRIWPIEGRVTQTANKTIGEGRPESCSCACQGTSDCVKRHIHESRQLLLSELGPAFFKMNFDEIGPVPETWTPKEEQRFEALVAKNPLSGNADFWEIASKCFTSKSRKCLLSYYYHVFLPKRVRSLTKASGSDEVESDDDHAGDFYVG